MTTLVYSGPGWQVIEASYQDVIDRLPQADFVFVDPPYFLSTGGSSCSAGKRTSVDKGDWDIPASLHDSVEFHFRWARACRGLLADDGTLMVSGTMHSIYMCGYALQVLEYRLLNDIVWDKVNPPPNLGCRCFTHGTETILWAAKSKKSKYYFDYQTMKELNDGKQMKNIWSICRAGADEKKFGKHPTQKPALLLDRCVLAAAPPKGLVVDPMCGSGATGVAAVYRGRRFIGIDEDPEYAWLAAQNLGSLTGALRVDYL